jgi:hypothetical protein
MHSSLKPKTNIVLLVVWATLAVVTGAASTPTSMVILGVGAFLGCVVGLVQHRALKLAGPELVKANSLIEVRKALSFSLWGKSYLYLFWSSVVVLLALGLWKFEKEILFVFLAGYSALAFTRELVTLPAIFSLRSLVAR